MCALSDDALNKKLKDEKKGDKFTSSEILRDDFKLSLRGYNRQEVDKFLAKIKENYHQLLERNRILFKEVENLKKELNKYKEKESRIEEALISAQRSAQLINESSSERAKLIVKEAEVKAKKTIEDGEKEYNELKEEITSLRRQKRLFLTKLKSLIKAHSELLEFYEDKLLKESTEKEVKTSFPSPEDKEGITFEEE
ncbi:MAG: DivIVA domain-containing protein [Candidatus Aerophobetes bacterium]|nr:DivIVA domain-containing protein [Candidatus Aerophobetes bacterium]